MRLINNLLLTGNKPIKRILYLQDYDEFFYFPGDLKKSILEYKRLKSGRFSIIVPDVEVEEIIIKSFMTFGIKMRQLIYHNSLQVVYTDESAENIEKVILDLREKGFKFCFKVLNTDLYIAV